MTYSNTTPKCTYITIFVLLLGGFSSLLNETVLNIGFSLLMKTFGVTATTIQWLTVGYVLVVAIMVPITAILIHTFTTKKLFVTAMSIFLAGTVCAALSQYFAALLFSRLLQAIGAGMAAPIALSASLALVPKEKHGFITSICTCVLTLGPAVGPVFSGVILEYFSWQMLFLFIIPVIVLCIILGLLFIENTSDLTKPPIDILSILLSCIGFAGVVFGISILDAYFLRGLLFVVSGSVVLFLWGKRQLNLEVPMLNINILRTHGFVGSIIVLMLLQMMQFCIAIIVPMLYQNSYNLSTLYSALALLPCAFILAVYTPFAGKIYDHSGGKILIPSGMLIMAISNFALSRVSSETSFVTIILLCAILFWGLGNSFSTIQTFAFGLVPSKDTTDAVALANTAQQIGGAMGTPICMGLLTVFQSRYLEKAAKVTSNTESLSLFSGFSHTMLVLGVVFVIGFILAIALTWRKNMQNSAEKTN